MKELSKFVKQNSFNLLMFGWVRALVLNFKGITIEDAVRNFMKNNNVEEIKDANIHTLTTTYTRMVKEYMELFKTKTE